jgi:peptide/nickel transport system ATP-binding protein
VIDNLLETRNLGVRFAIDRGSVYAVDDVSITLRKGEITAIVGESGCGKSMLALSILGLAGANATVSGSILFEGQDLRVLPEARMRRLRGEAIGIVFQEPLTSLNPVLTVGSQVAEVLRRHKGLRRGEARRQTIDLFRQVGIASPERRVDSYPHQLSGGMAQRVMIAMAIACRPRLLIADEPTTALDVTIQAGILRLLLELRERFGVTIMLITHDLGVVADIADRVVVMYAGRAVETASVGDLFAQPQHPYTLGLLGAIRRPDWPATAGGRRRLQEIPGTVPTRHTQATHCLFADRCPRSAERCWTELPLLGWPAKGEVDHAVACFYPGPERVVRPPASGPIASDTVSQRLP